MTDKEFVSSMYLNPYCKNAPSLAWPTLPCVIMGDDSNLRRVWIARGKNEEQAWRNAAKFVEEKVMNSLQR